MKIRKIDGLRLLTHVFGEVMIVFGSIVLAINFTNNSFSLNIISLTGLYAILIGAFCQWNPD